MPGTGRPTAVGGPATLPEQTDSAILGGLCEGGSSLLPSQSRGLKSDGPKTNEQEKRHVSLGVLIFSRERRPPRKEAENRRSGPVRGRGVCDITAEGSKSWRSDQTKEMGLRSRGATLGLVTEAKGCSLRLSMQRRPGNITLFSDNGRPCLPCCREGHPVPRQTHSLLEDGGRWPRAPPGSAAPLSSVQDNLYAKVVYLGWHVLFFFF